MQVHSTTLLVQGAGVDAVVGTINGDAVTTVDATEVDIDGVQTLVYEILQRQILTRRSYT